MFVNTNKRRRTKADVSMRPASALLVVGLLAGVAAVPSQLEIKFPPKGRIIDVERAELSLWVPNGAARLPLDPHAIRICMSLDNKVNLWKLHPVRSN